MFLVVADEYFISAVLLINVGVGAGALAIALEEVGHLIAT